jgi:hypothetical protein
MQNSNFFAPRFAPRFMVWVVFLSGCVDHPCHTFRDPEKANVAPSSQRSATTSPIQNNSAVNSPSSEATASVSKVFIYKPDGSKQCSQGKGLSAEEMEKQLSGLNISYRDKRSDGQMHILVCGHPTGMINVYEISLKDFSSAEALGFKKLDHY